jgi:diguanylate cyclase (GGDEF)-like protein
VPGFRPLKDLPPAWLATLALAVALFASALAVRCYAQILEREAQATLQRAADRFELIIHAQLEACGNLVRAIQLQLQSDPQMDADAFEAHVGSLRAQRVFPALQAAAFARLERAPDGSERYPTVLVAPRAGNERLVGLDVVSQPENLVVLKQALAQDEPLLSGPFRLIQMDEKTQALDGFVIRLPVLASGLPPRNAAEREARELGSIAVSFRLSTLVDQALGRLDYGTGFELRLFADAQDGGGQLYSSATSGLSRVGDPALAGASGEVRYGDRAWALQLVPKPGWYAPARRTTLLSAAVLALCSLLLAAVVGSLARIRQQAQRQAAQAEQRAEDFEQRFRQLGELLPVATVLARLDDGEIVDTNTAGRRLLALGPEQRARLADFGIDPPRDAAAAADADESRELRDAAGRSFHASLRERRIEVDARSLRLLVIEDVSERMQLTAQLRHQASHDALTGLRNRREFDRRLQLAVDGSEPLLPMGALFYLDLDQFKLINDTCGHAAGDSLLAQVSGSLLQALPSNTLVARLGGDEFGILAAVDSAQGIRQLAELLRAAVAATPFFWEGRQFALGASIGAVALEGSGQRSAQELLAIADTACYLAKEAGRDRVVVHDEDERVSRLRRDEMDWVQRIREALEQDRFCLCYQELAPLAPDAAGGAHFELLVRMIDERGDMVPAGAFIPAAERFGVMPSIDRWVVRRALRDFERLHPSGAAIDLCAINLSGATMGDESFPGYLLQELRASGVEPRRLCFEITETAAVANFAQAEALLADLRELGCRVALDDFGAGMSSFGYLKRLAVDFIKIDGSFIRELENDPMSQSIVRAITELGHQFGARVVAEFVGRESTRELLTAMGVDYAQGYGIHVPQPCPSQAVGQGTN